MNQLQRGAAELLSLIEAEVQSVAESRSEIRRFAERARDNIRRNPELAIRDLARLIDEADEMDRTLVALADRIAGDLHEALRRRSARDAEAQEQREQLETMRENNALMQQALAALGHNIIPLRRNA